MPGKRIERSSGPERAGDQLVTKESEAVLVGEKWLYPGLDEVMCSTYSAV
jgi:hypothetical protein